MDEELTERVRRALTARRGPLRRGPGRHRVVGAAAVADGRVQLAHLGAAPDADFEIGSISKGITGLLYVDALARGEITPTSTLGDLLPLGDAPVAGVPLAAVATHTSGLPRLPKDAQPLRRTIALWRHGRNPYGESLDDLLAQVRTLQPRRPEPKYSNLGYELLGHAVAAGAGTTYGALVRDRLAEPLGLDAFYAPSTPDDLRPQALLGTNRAGHVVEPWTGEAIAPAGGIRATVAAMGRLVAALLDGTAPGAAALDPVATFRGPLQIGAAWITLDVKGRTITWHNGGTGGFRTWLGLDRTAGTGLVLMSATSSSVDRYGFDLLREITDEQA